MSHYPYHSRIKQRINNGGLTGFEFVDEYNKIKPCLLLYFSTEPYCRPIREYRWKDYEFITKQETNETNNKTKERAIKAQQGCF